MRWNRDNPSSAHRNRADPDPWVARQHGDGPGGRWDPPPGDRDPRARPVHLPLPRLPPQLEGHLADAVQTRGLEGVPATEGPPGGVHRQAASEIKVPPADRLAGPAAGGVLLRAAFWVILFLTFVLLVALFLVRRP